MAEDGQWIDFFYLHVGDVVDVAADELMKDEPPVATFIRLRMSREVGARGVQSARHRDGASIVTRPFTFCLMITT